MNKYALAAVLCLALPISSFGCNKPGDTGSTTDKKEEKSKGDKKADDDDGKSEKKKKQKDDDKTAKADDTAADDDETAAAATPVPSDYAEAAQTSIKETDYKSRLDQIEAEIGKE